MADRFEKLFQLSANQHSKGSPVILAAGALLKDNATGKIVVQLKFQSVSEKRIKAIKVSLAAYDVAGAELQGVSDYQYLDLNVSNGHVFATNKAIMMPLSITRSFSVTSVVVIFHDGSTWHNEQPFETLPSTSSLDSALQSAELKKQYRLVTNEKAGYVPQKVNNIWQCSCGTWNGGTICTHCRISQSKVFSAYDIPALKAQMTLRIEQEKAKAAEAAAQEAKRQAEAAEREKERREKAKIQRTRIIKISIIVFAILVLATVAIFAAQYIHKQSSEITMEEMLPLYSKDETIAYLGDAKNTNSYDVYFSNNWYKLTVNYDGNNLNKWSLDYQYPGMKSLKTVAAVQAYIPTAEDVAVAKTIINELISQFAAAYGEYEVFNSTVNTVTYTWTVWDRQIQLYDYTGNNELGRISAVSVVVNCDCTSFCKHPETKNEHLDATCTENGYDRAICTICGYVDESAIPAFGHTIETLISQEPTCSSEGVKTAKCSVCGITESEPIAKIPHNNKSAVTQEPTCTVEGIKTYTCTVCGHTTEEKIDMVEHTYIDEVTQEPTCVSEGIKTYTCTVCGHTIEEKISIVEHQYSDQVTTEPTCSAEGVKTSTCLVCGKTIETAIDMLPHSYEEIIIQQAGCMTTGTKEERCSVCGSTTDPQAIPATGHSYSQYAIDESTCEANGTRYMRCSNCGDEYTEAVLAIGHSWTEATCEQAEHCVNCGKTIGDPLGHSWGYLHVYGTPKCSRCGGYYILPQNPQ